MKRERWLRLTLGSEERDRGVRLILSSEERDRWLRLTLRSEEREMAALNAEHVRESQLSAYHSV